MRSKPGRCLWLVCLLLVACSTEQRALEPMSVDMEFRCLFDGVACNGVCVNVKSDPRHCGACNNACPAGTVCHRGACSLRCGDGTTACGGACVDLTTDAAHCGACGRACPADRTCREGTCRCAGATQDCGGTCVDTNQDSQHCGSCNHSCGSQGQCINGRCVLKTYGSGADGVLEVPAGTTRVLNEIRSPVTGGAGSRELLLARPEGFRAGQTVLLHQTMGPEAGYWELAVIVQMDGKRAWLAAPLVHSYLIMLVHRAQAVVVPQYTDVRVAAGAVLQPPAWDGTTGGILALQATGRVEIAGEVRATALGYRGFSHATLCGTRCAFHGFYGESHLGPSQASIRDGGGFGLNNGPGGGGGTVGQDCAAGGGGGYGSRGGQGATGTNGVCVTPPHGGGYGGTEVGDGDLGKAIFFGGAGGEGGPDEDGSHPGAGGHGGGIIMIWARQFQVTGRVLSHGGAGGNSTNNSAACGGGGCGMGAGGGGAGGGIRIVADEATLGTNLITALGGPGGSCDCGGFPGGTGGVGRIQVRAASVSGTTNPPFTN
ncbi:MAG: hypothetical protein RMK29_10055 [Myxococcales bacterium]|nr:hypothetical protein [Myxococcota bacterium]MDW8282045.1 hypothetical protein [Myxococcales bacterium]